MRKMKPVNGMELGRLASRLREGVSVDRQTLLRAAMTCGCPECLEVLAAQRLTPFIQRERPLLTVGDVFHE